MADDHSYTLQCGTIMTLISPGDCTMQRGMWIMTVNSPNGSRPTCNVTRGSGMTCRLRWCVEMETRCRIPIWRTIGRIQWHVIPEPRITLQGAATLVNSLSRFQSHMPHCSCAVTWRNQCHDRATLQSVRIPTAILKIVFRRFFFNAV